MEWDHERQQEKEEELTQMLEATLTDQDCDARALAEQIIGLAVDVSPPEKEQFTLELMTFRNDGRGGGRSRKPGNIRFNMGKLVEAVSAGVITAVGAIQAPITIPFAALVLWNSIWRCVDVELSEADAALVYVMWMHQESDRYVAEQGLQQKLNDHLEKYGRQSMSEYDMKHSMEKLEKIGSIKKAKKHGDYWQLCERIKPEYN